MSGILASVDSRTNLVGENRLELLMFRLSGSQIFAINVFKIQEVVQLPKLHELPYSHEAIRGVAHLRGHAVPVIDLSRAIGRKPITLGEHCTLIVTEYNQSVQGFLVGPVERIVNLNWDEIQPPPKASGNNHFLTAFTKLNEKIVEILDVEKILAEIIPYSTDISEEIRDLTLRELVGDRKLEILSVDDSPTARAQIRETLAHLELDIILHVESDGLKGLNRLKKWVSEGVNLNEKLLMVITDAEMPEMDGYRLTHEIRTDPAMKDLFVVMHTSLSGSFNKNMTQKVGCNSFLSKFRPDELAALVQKRISDRYSPK